MYTTDGIVLKRRPFGEANAVFYVLTKDLGLIIGSAQSVRSIHSKLSSALVEYSLISLSAIKGKNGWKITNASTKENFFFGSLHFAQKVISQVADVLVRMMPGEERHSDVFHVVSSGFQYVKSVSESDIAYFEILMMIRILYHLGYVSREEITEQFLTQTTEWNRDLLTQVGLSKKDLVQKINNGLKESQL